MATAITLFAARIRKFAAEACELAKTLKRWVPEGETTSPRTEALRSLQDRLDELLPLLVQRAKGEALDAGVFDEIVPVIKKSAKLLDQAIRACWGRDWVELELSAGGKARRSHNRSPLPHIFELVESEVTRLESAARSLIRARRSETKRAGILVGEGHTVKVGRKRHRLTPAQCNFVRRLLEADGAFVVGPPNTRWDRMRERLPADLRKLIEGKTGSGGGYRIRPVPKRAARRRP